LQSPHEKFIPEQATWYFRQVETWLADLRYYLDLLSQEMRALSREHHELCPESKLILHLKKREDKRPTALQWGVLKPCPEGLARKLSSLGGAYRRWRVQYVKKLSSNLIYIDGKDIAREPLWWDFDRRARALNDAYHLVRGTLMSLENALHPRRRRRSWEGGDLDHEAPGVSPKLRPLSQRALAGAWPYILRMVATQYELLAQVERYREFPAHPAVWLAFEADREHPWGRSTWRFSGGHLRRAATKRRSPAILTDRLMRQLRMTESERRALAPHERERRRMAALYRRYTTVMVRLKRATRRTIDAADLGILAARRLANPAG
jgi:hypothetical protein